MPATDPHLVIAARSAPGGASESRRGYAFGPYRLDLLERRLLKGGEPVTLTPKAYELLAALVERRNRAVTKAELMQLLWPDSFVEEANLTQTVFVLRKALGELPSGGDYIETIPRHGYRFAPKVDEIAAEPLRSVSATTAAATQTVPWWNRRRALIAALVLTAAVAALVAVRGARLARVKPVDAGSPASLAVLPFKSLSPGEEANYLGLGMADTLITRLGNLPQITVRPTRSVLGFAQSSQDVVQVGRSLQVAYILDGSVQQVGERLRVNVQLLDVRTGAPLWTGAFDERLTDIFAVQDSISAAVAEALVANVTGGDRTRLDRRYTDNIEAYQQYIRGRYHWNRRGEADLRKSIDHFEQAIRSDPRYALAYAGLADAYNMMANWSFMPAREAYTRAQAAAVRALAIDDGLVEAQVALVFARFLLERDWPAADRGFRDAIARRPDYAPAHQWYGIYLASIGQHERAAAEVRRAAELEPLSSIIQSVLSWVLYLGRRYDEAIEQCRVTLELDPSYYAALVYLGEAYEQKDMFAEARASLERARAISGGRPRDLGALGHLYAKHGMRAEAEKILGELERQATTAYVEPFYVALVHLGLGSTDRALDALERSHENGFPWVIHWNVSPRLDPLRGHARFDALIERAGLERAAPVAQTRD